MKNILNGLARSPPVRALLLRSRQVRSVNSPRLEGIFPETDKRNTPVNYLYPTTTKDHGSVKNCFIDFVTNQATNFRLKKAIILPERLLWGRQSSVKRSWQVTPSQESSGEGLPQPTLLTHLLPLVFLKKSHKIFLSWSEMDNRNSKYIYLQMQSTNVNITIPSKEKRERDSGIKNEIPWSSIIHMLDYNINKASEPNNLNVSTSRRFTQKKFLHIRWLPPF